MIFATVLIVLALFCSAYLITIPLYQIAENLRLIQERANDEARKNEQELRRIDSEGWSRMTGERP